MNLEQRVDVVEQELNLIKAQIQEILLQIQEQLLKEAHPVLRAEENRKAAARAPEVDAAPPSRPTPAARSNGAAPTSENHLANGRPAPSREYPQAKQVRADSFAEQPAAPQQPLDRRPAERQPNRQPTERRPAPAPTPIYVPPAQPTVRANGHNGNNNHNGSKPAAPNYEPAEVKVWIQLDQWVSQKVREMGVARTRHLISLCDEPERSLLMQFIDVYDERSTPSAPAARQPYPAQPYQNQPYADQSYANAPYPTEPYARPYNPSSERQDLVLRLITTLLDDAQRPAPYAPNGSGYGTH